MSDPTQGLTAAELYLACTMRKETRGMGYPERLDASTLTEGDVAAYRRVYGDQHAARTAPGHCTDTARHDPHQYGDDEVWHCPGATGEDAEPRVCRSPRCPRPGTSGSGWCCYGCAAHTRFGRELLHNRPCETANPGVEETTPPLRDRIAQALYEAPESQDGPLANLARTVAVQRANRRTDAVMEVVQDEQKHARADHLLDLDPIETRTNTAAEGPWYPVANDLIGGWCVSQQDAPPSQSPGVPVADFMRREDAVFTANARQDMPALVARVRELEEENDRLRTRQEFATADWCIPATLDEVIDRFEQTHNPWPPRSGHDE